MSPGATIPAADWRRPTRRRVTAIRDRLRDVYGVPIMAPHEQPLDELILTVLSQSTNDRNRDVAYERLRERFPSWEAVLNAPNAEVEEAIRPGGISKVKSARIQADPARRSTRTSRTASTCAGCATCRCPRARRT